MVGAVSLVKFLGLVGSEALSKVFFEVKRGWVGQFRLSRHWLLSLTGRAGELKARIRVDRVSPLPTTIHRYHRLLKGAKVKDIFDLYLAATLMDNGVKKLLTVNVKDFQGVEGLRVINPFEGFEAKGKGHS